KATSLQVNEQFTPALRTFAHADLEADQFLPAFRRRPYEDQHAGGIVLHARLKIDAVGPDVDIVAGRQVAGLPADIVTLPLLLQAPDRRWRQVRRVATQKRAKRFPEIAGRDAAQVENRYESVEALRATCPFRQERRGEGDAVLAGSFRGSITQLGTLDRHRTNPRLDHPFRPVAMTHHTGAPIGQALLGHGGKKRLGLRLDGLRKKSARALAQNRCQGFVESIRMRKGNNGGICLHGVSLLERFWQALHPPRYAASLKPSSPSFRHSSRDPGANL